MGCPRSLCHLKWHQNQGRVPVCARVLEDALAPPPHPRRGGEPERVLKPPGYEPHFPRPHPTRALRPTDSGGGLWLCRRSRARWPVCAGSHPVPPPQAPEGPSPQAGTGGGSPRSPRSPRWAALALSPQPSLRSTAFHAGGVWKRLGGRERGGGGRPPSGPPRATRPEPSGRAWALPGRICGGRRAALPPTGRTVCVVPVGTCPFQATGPLNLRHLACVWTVRL